MYNFGFLGPSALDRVIPVSRQEHWATGGGDFGFEQYAAASRRTPGPVPKLYASKEALRARDLGDGWRATGADLVVMALALIVSQTIPDAPALEGDYWTLSDYPSTAGGRFATLNVGGLELAFFPRRSWFDDGVDTVVLNLPAGTILKGASPAVDRGMRTAFTEAAFPNGAACWAASTNYGMTVTDTVVAPTVDLLTEDWRIADTLRAFAVDLMRAGNSRKFARWHSTELARRVYQQVANPTP